MPAPIIASSTAQGPRSTQDDLCAWAYYPGPASQEDLCALLVVADGMGGEGPPGEGGRAARVAVSAALYGGDTPTQGAVRRVFLRASDQVRAQYPQGGTTLSMLHLTKTGTLTSWVGDSPVLRIRAGVVTLLAYPDNVPGRRWHSGQITEDQYRRSQARNRLMSYVGLGPGAANEPLTREGSAPRPGDLYVLLTDGAFDPWGTQGVLAAAQQYGMDPPALAAALVQGPPGGSGIEDNATALVALVV